MFHMDNISGYNNISEKVTVVELFCHYILWVGLFLKNLYGLFMSFNCWSHIYVKKNLDFFITLLRSAVDVTELCSHIL